MDGEANAATCNDLTPEARSAGRSMDRRRNLTNAILARHTTAALAELEPIVDRPEVRARLLTQAALAHHVALVGPDDARRYVAGMLEVIIAMVGADG